MVTCMPMSTGHVGDGRDDQQWRALADPTRREILDVLRLSPSTTGGIASRFPISRVAVMKHLGVLADAGLVTSRKRGRERWHYVNVAPLLRLHERWSTPMSASVAGGLLGLKHRAEQSVSAEVSAIDIAVDVDIACDVGTAFRAVTQTPGAWWGHPYLRPNATSLSLDPVLGGALVEHWSGGAMVMATVTGLGEDHWLQLTGPFHLGPAYAVTEFDFVDAADGCRVSLTLRGSGLLDPATVEGFSGGWHELITVRLKAFAEGGTRLGIDPG